MKRNLFSRLRAVLLTILLLSASLSLSSCTLLKGPAKEVSYTLNVRQGATARSIGKELEDAGIVKNAAVFYYYARYKKSGIKTGVYQLDDTMDVEEILALLESGKQRYITVSVPEGYTMKQIAAILEEKGVTEKESFLKMCRSPALLAEYRVPSTTLEGYLFPETYFFEPGMESERVVRMMVDTFFKKLAGEIPELLEKSPDDLNYVVKLASIVEKEYKLEEEAPLIASAFSNRLKIGQGLYSCATVVYIITEILDRPHPGTVTIEDTRIESPYNTYIHAGLPPTAISNPGIVALKAAAHPAKTRYRYFRVVDESIGKHVFSEDFEEHKEAGREIEAKNRR